MSEGMRRLRIGGALVAAIEDLAVDQFLPAGEQILTLGPGISALSRYG